MFDKTLVRYFFVGCLSTLTHYLVSSVFYYYLGKPVVVATAVGFAFSWLLAYCCNYRFTFQSNVQHKKSVCLYLLVTTIGFVLNLLIMYSGVECFNIEYTAVFIFMSIIVFMNNYILSKVWVFK